MVGLGEARPDGDGIAGGAGSVHPGEGEDGPGEVRGKPVDDAIFVDEKRFEERDPRWLCVIEAGREPRERLKI